MNSIVIYASHFGNTKKIAEAIADGLRTRGAVRLLSVEEASAMLPAGTDLVVIGGPTEAHRMTEPLARFFQELAPDALQGIAVAAFDTRLDMSRWLSGSAAVGITRKLRQWGAWVIGPAQSFFVAGKTPELLPGELERATAWGASLAAQVEAKAPAVAGTAS